MFMLPASAKAYFLLIYFFILVFIFQSCKPLIATYDDGSFVKTAELKAKTMVLMSHANEDFPNFRNNVDEIMITAETLYAMQKARAANALTVAQWDIMMKGTLADRKGSLPTFFNMWRKKEKLNELFIEPAKEQIGSQFDEILKLEAAKLPAQQTKK